MHHRQLSLPPTGECNKSATEFIFLFFKYFIKDNVNTKGSGQEVYILCATPFPSLFATSVVKLYFFKQMYNYRNIYIVVAYSFASLYSVILNCDVRQDELEFAQQRPDPSVPWKAENGAVDL